MRGPKSPSPGGAVSEFMAESRNVVQEKCRGRGASSRGFAEIFGEWYSYTYFCGRCNTGALHFTRRHQEVAPSPSVGSGSGAAGERLSVRRVHKLHDPAKI